MTPEETRRLEGLEQRMTTQEQRGIEAAELFLEAAMAIDRLNERVKMLEQMSPSGALQDLFASYDADDSAPPAG